MMTTLTASPIKASYDERMDVLYIVLDAVPCEGDGRERGVELDFSLSDGKPSAVTVIGFRRNGWRDELNELAKIVAAHLSGDGEEIANLIEEAVDREARREKAEGGRARVDLTD